MIHVWRSTLKYLFFERVGSSYQTYRKIDITTTILLHQLLQFILATAQPEIGFFPDLLCQNHRWHMLAPKNAFISLLPKIPQHSHKPSCSNSLVLRTASLKNLPGTFPRRKWHFADFIFFSDSTLKYQMTIKLFKIW